jgi:Ca2+-binding RTX toxin-like protein
LLGNFSACRDIFQDIYSMALIIGDNGNNYIPGTNVADVIYGLGGNDTLGGGGGVDEIYGGSGDDYIYAAVGTPETLDGGSGVDWLNTASWSGNYNINLATGVTNYVGESFTNFENLYLGSGNDYVLGTTGANRIYGNDGNDFIDGLGGNDFISGGDGNDSLRGGGGTDTVYGGNGNDTIFSSGFGLYDGDAGNDYIYAAAGTPETLVGGTGVDWLNTASWAGNYSINMISGVTNYAGESFVEFENLYTGSGNDTIVATNGANTVYTNAGNDRVSGLAGNDVLNGGVGIDVLRGGMGADYLYGEGGNDVFDFDFAAESTGATADVIAGFDNAGPAPGDRCDVSTIDANALTGVNDAFTFYGVLSNNAGLAQGAGALWVNNVGGETRVWANTDNDNAIEMHIRIADGAVVAGSYTDLDFFL